jgi:S-methylmethionine-dependent homocysteine/selenocysteine methylase
MADDETPTPRLTGRWQGLVSAAREVAQKLREVELAKSRVSGQLDPHGANLARQLRMVCTWYEGAFSRWTTNDVHVVEKQRQMDQFFALSELVKRVLEETPK